MSKHTAKLNEIEESIKDNHQRPKFKFRPREFKFTKKQQEIITTTKDDRTKVVIMDGPAGTGKSLLCIYIALLIFQEKRCDDILYLRTAVENSSKTLGFLKGDLDEKFSVYRQILDDKIEELVAPSDQYGLLNSSVLEALPINYIRGASWRNKFVVLDECQNTTISEAKTLLTRMGKGTTLVLCGDTQQSDIRDSGMCYLKQIFDNPESREQGIALFQLDSGDVVRSDIVQYIVRKFEEFEKKGVNPAVRY